jgi:hypothetical protein
MRKLVIHSTFATMMMIATHCVLDLSEDVFVHCLSYLTPEELSQCNSVGSVFSHRVHHESLWKYWLADSFGIDSNSLEYPPGYPQDQIVNSCMNCFISWKLSFPGYSSHDVRRTNNWWKRFESWCRQYAPEILTTLNPPASESDIDTVESDLKCPLPCSLKIFYRFHNGQHIPHQNRASIGWGIFGGTQFYDSFVNMKFLSLDFLGRFTPQCRSMDSDILPHPKCLGINPNGQSMSLVDNNLYYEDDDINGLLSNHLPDSNRAPVDSVEDLFVFAKSIGRTQKVYCIGSDHPSNSRGGIVYVNTSKLKMRLGTYSPLPLLRSTDQLSQETLISFLVIQLLTSQIIKISIPQTASFFFGLKNISTGSCPIIFASLFSLPPFLPSFLPSSLPLHSSRSPSCLLSSII